MTGPRTRPEADTPRAARLRAALKANLARRKAQARARAATGSGDSDDDHDEAAQPDDGDAQKE